MHSPKKRQNLMFSATFSPEIKRLAGNFLTDPVVIEVARPKRNSCHHQAGGLLC